MIELGYGAGAIADYPWHLDGSRPWTEDDYASARECLESLSEIGIRWVDTAHRYGQGISESMVGAYAPDGVRVITKVELTTLAAMKELLVISKARLGRIDAVLLHNPDLSRRRELADACQWLCALREARKPELEFVGFSTEPDRNAEWYYERFPLNMIEFPYSMNDRRAEDQIFTWPRRNIKTVANRILGGPALDGEPRDVMGSLKFIADQAQWIDVALIGTTNPEHLRGCAHAMQAMLCP